MSKLGNTRIELLHHFFRNFFLAQAYLKKTDKILVEQQGISFSCWQLITVIRLYSPQKATTSLMAETLSISRQAIQKHIQHLIKDGLVEMVENKEDKRSPFYILTLKGNNLCDYMVKNVYEKLMEHAFEHLSDEEIITATNLLKYLQTL